MTPDVEIVPANEASCDDLRTIFGARGSGLVSRMWMRDDLSPGTTRYRRSTCGCGAFGQRHDEQAFQPK